MTTASAAQLVKINCEHVSPFFYYEDNSALDMYQLKPGELDASRIHVCMFDLPLQITEVMKKVLSYFEQTLFTPNTPMHEKYKVTTYSFACKHNDTSCNSENSVSVLMYSFPKNLLYEKALQFAGEAMGQPLNHFSKLCQLQFPKYSRNVEIRIPKSDNVLVFAEKPKGVPSVTLAFVPLDDEKSFDTQSKK